MKVILKDGKEFNMTVVQQLIDSEGINRTNIYLQTEDVNLDEVKNAFNDKNIKDIKFEREDGTSYNDNFTKIDQISRRFSDTEDVINVNLL